MIHERRTWEMSVVLIQRAVSRACAFSSVPPSCPPRARLYQSLLHQPSARVILNLQRESRFLSLSTGLALVHGVFIPSCNQARQFNGGSRLIIYFPPVYEQLFFELRAGAPWFYDLAVMGLSDNPVSRLDVPSFGIFQPSETRVHASCSIRILSFSSSTTPVAAALLVFRWNCLSCVHTDLCTYAWLDLNSRRRIALFMAKKIYRIIETFRYDMDQINTRWWSKIYWNCYVIIY